MLHMVVMGRTDIQETEDLESSDEELKKALGGRRPFMETRGV